MTDTTHVLSHPDAEEDALPAQYVDLTEPVVCDFGGEDLAVGTWVFFLPTSGDLGEFACSHCVLTGGFTVTPA